MMLDGPSVGLPIFEPSTLYSFYPHQLSPRSHVHSTLFPSSSDTLNSQPGPSKQGRSGQHSKQDGGDNLGQNSTSLWGELTRNEIRDSMKRAEMRAVMGRRPAGTGLGKEDDEVILEEDTLDHEQHDINMFGHRFLLPYGRRLTQMEMDAAPSPSPSEPDHEHRQEDPDRSMLSPPRQLMNQNGVDDEDRDINDDEDQERDGGGVDLDASIEDLDASLEGEDEGSTEDD